MSGVIGPELRRDESGEPEAYTPGNADYAVSVAAIVAHHQEWVERNHEHVIAKNTLLWNEREREAYLSDVIERARLSEGAAGFNAQGFLDAVVAGLCLADPEQPEVVLSDIIQVLYTIGIDGLTLDTTRLGEGNPLVYGLKGSERSPLRLTCVCGPDASVGLSMDYCHVTMPQGVREVGQFSEHSTYRVEGDARIGPHPEHCDFYLRSFDGVDIDDLKFFTPERCSFYLEKGPGSSTLDLLAELEDGKFISKGNKLYVADGCGGWKDITPRASPFRDPFGPYIQRGEEMDGPPWWRKLLDALGGKSGGDGR